MPESKPNIIKLLARTLKVSEDQIIAIENGVNGALFEKSFKVADLKSAIKAYNYNSGRNPIPFNPMNKAQCGRAIKEILAVGTYVCPRHRAVYDELVSTDGVAGEEVIRELTTVGEDEDIDYDTILFRIVDARSAGDLPDHITQQNMNYDAAALASEQERDAIQERKRKRQYDLQHGLDLGFSAAQEYAASAFLGRCPTCELYPCDRYVRVNTNGMKSVAAVSSSSSGSSSTSTTQSLVQQSGSATVKFLVSLVDELEWCRPVVFAQMAEFLGPDAGEPSHIDKDMEHLNKLLSKLLQLEVSSKHWYPTASVPFLFKVASILDTMSSGLFRTLSKPCGRIGEEVENEEGQAASKTALISFDPTTSCKKTSELEQWIQAGNERAVQFATDLKTVIALLEKIINRWEKRMSKISYGAAGDDARPVPVMYTDAVERFKHWDATPVIELEDDGLEIESAHDTTLIGPAVLKPGPSRIDAVAAAAASASVPISSVSTAADAAPDASNGSNACGRVGGGVKTYNWADWSESEAEETCDFDEDDYYADD